MLAPAKTCLLIQYLIVDWTDSSTATAVGRLSIAVNSRVTTQLTNQFPKIDSNTVQVAFFFIAIFFGSQITSRVPHVTAYELTKN